MRHPRSPGAPSSWSRSQSRSASRGEGPLLGSGGPDAARLFAVCMFCIFPGPAALAAGAAGKEACRAVCSTSPDSDGWRLAPQPSPRRSAHEASGTSEVFTNGWKPGRTGLVRPPGGERGEVPHQHAPCRWSTHLLLFSNCTFVIPKVARLPPSLSFVLGPFAQLHHFSVPVDTPPRRACVPLLAGAHCAGLYSPCVVPTSSQCSQEVSGCQVLANIPVKIARVHLAEELRADLLDIGKPLCVQGVGKNRHLGPGCRLGQSWGVFWKNDVISLCLSFPTCKRS